MLEIDAQKSEIEVVNLPPLERGGRLIRLDGRWLLVPANEEQPKKRPAAPAKAKKQWTRPDGKPTLKSAVLAAVEAGPKTARAVYEAVAGEYQSTTIGSVGQALRELKREHKVLYDDDRGVWRKPLVLPKAG